MALKSDLTIDVAKLREDAIPKSLEDFNKALTAIERKGPAWYEVSYFPWTTQTLLHSLTLPTLGWSRQISGSSNQEGATWP